ncbi:COP9 signalosome [Mycena belliarum]|uniref:COP9 signalosome n=1 Tax=Mycena belliarum TaxID=1033014 RepID=A0AAD6U099_9AGAR|nr:COP9 signalosome [Mycena belliae]
MSTAGPPTPPPISETEIQDATRTVVPPLPAASTSAPVPEAAPPPQARQDNFTQIFPQIASLASEKNFRELIQVAELNDVASDGDRQPSRLLLIAPLVLSYLIIDDLPPARCAFMRLPTNLATTPLAKQLHSLLASTSERKYTNVYARANGLLELVGQSDFFDASLGALLGLMIQNFLEAFRQRTFELLAKAYTSLALPLAEMYLGISADAVLPIAQTEGWAFDSSTNVLSPVQKSNTNQTANGFAPFSSLATFDLVANSVARLET